jgi:crotonobetainyl-CoA:carnitine CoA-transferase CaiB-like acyl-CoA transferase
MGADVIKVETPDGDIFRYSGKPARSRGMSPGQMTLNRGKRSIVLDLKNPADAKVMEALVTEADVFIHNVRGQAIERLGFGYEAVKTLKPDIIYVHCVGFGSGGPYADLQAYDDVIQAASGTATLASRVDGDPRARYIPSLIADKVAGLHGAYATLAAVVHRLRTGEGQFVEVPMFEAFTHFMLKEHLAGQTFDPSVGTICYGRQIDPDRQPFPTADGYISIVPYTDASYGRLFSVLGAPEVLDEENLATPYLRAVNVRKIYQAIAALTPSKTTAEWLAAFRAASIPAMAVRDIGEIREDPHLQAVNFFERREHPTEGAYFDMQAPVKFGAAPTQSAAYPATLGEHSDDIRAHLWGSVSAATD